MESLQLHLEIRFSQLNTAIELQLWQVNIFLISLFKKKLLN